METNISLLDAEMPASQDGQVTIRKRPSHIVGVGASAGGLEALERLFDGMPGNTGLAFVIVQHLSPDFKSVMDELLARRTSIPVRRVEDGMEVEADSIYLIPPKKDMIISNGKLLVTDKDPSLLPLPIDHFFRSLAQDAGESAIAIVLSGTGSDGSRGIRDIHDAGGLVIVQNLETAKFDGMPRSAQKTGVVDLTLAPEEMPAALLKYVNRFQVHETDKAVEREPVQGGMEMIFRLLRSRFDIDFSCYKPNTVGRRTERRLLLNHSLDLDDYIKRLTDDPDELNSLYKDLLIGVTRFFRDEDAFDRLGALLPDILVNRPHDDEVRVWVAGCATGEEAYSLAILLQEQIDRLRDPVKIKVFATDVHRTSLETASAGIYSEASLADVSPGRLDRFFIRKGDNYQVTPDLRKMVVFAHHNIIKDAPFTKLDLISCRNMLIYLQPLAQKKVLSLFHFGLRTGGILFVGPSETPGELSDEFEVLEAHWKIYRKRRDIRLPPEMRMPLSVGATRARSSTLTVPASIGSLSDQGLIGTYDALLEKFMPPSVLVNEDRQLVQTFGGASQFLQIRDGRLSTDILELVDPDVRIALSGALQRSVKEGSQVVYKGLRVHTADGERLVNISVQPVRNTRSIATYTLVSFEQLEAVPPPTTTEIDLPQASRDQMLSLESELRFTRENLQATIEELETSNEELQATNEELVASNEELQSTNEELHSVNEELYTVNAEYQKKIQELTELTADMENLLASTDVHTVFLDRDLCIRKFTPKMAEVFNLLPQDLGRRIDSFTYTIDHRTLVEDIQRVMRTGELFEKQVQDRRGNWFFLRVLPYHAGASVAGAVVTLIDIQGLKRAEARAGEKDRLLRDILNNTPNPIFVKDLAGHYLLVDENFRRLLKCDPVGKTDYELFPEPIADQMVRNDERAIAEKTTVAVEETINHPEGPRTYLAIKFPLCGEDGRVIGLGGFKTDVTELKLAEQNARLGVEQRDRFLAMLSHELRNPLGAILNALSVTELSGNSPEAIKKWHGIIERRARHMARLLDDLLDVARLTHNKIEMRLAVCDLRSLVPEVLEETRQWIEEQELQLTVETGEEPLQVKGDPDRLQQLQVNLLSNAAKYTPRGGSISYRLLREGNEAVIRVRDTGIGISPDMRDKIFELFVQSDDMPDRSRGGLGLGLTLVRSIVEAHGGEIKAYSDGPGRGSEFVVRLPLSSEPALTPMTQPSSQGSPQLKVLLVEDDVDSRESLKAYLELEGFNVRSAATGLQALAEIDRDKPDVAIIDIGLPELSGYEVARRIRQSDDGRIRLIAVTGYGQPADRKSAMDAGFDEHFTKPLRPADLLRILGGTVSR